MNLNYDQNYLKERAGETLYTIKLKDLMAIDPTVFEFDYSPQILINGVDLKEYVAASFAEREIGQETPELFKRYLRKAFLLKADFIFKRYNMYLDLENKDQFIDNKSISKQVAKFYATPAEGYEVGEEIESTKNTGDQEFSSSSAYPIYIYKAYIDNLDNMIEDSVNEFEYLFMPLLD